MKVTVLYEPAIGACGPFWSLTVNGRHIWRHDSPEDAYGAAENLRLALRRNPDGTRRLKGAKP